MSESPRARYRRLVDLEPHARSDGPDWSMTFADTMSLLMGFFVLLISFSTFDETQFQSVAQGVQALFGRAPSSASASAVGAQVPGSAGPSPLAGEHRARADRLRGSVEAYAQQTRGAMAVERFETYRGLEMVLPADRVFIDNSDAVAPHGEGLLRFVGQTMRTDAGDRRLLVEVPAIEGQAVPPQFDGPWDLALSRALSVQAGLHRLAGVAAFRVVPTAAGVRAGTPSPAVTFVFERPQVKPE